MPQIVACSSCAQKFKAPDEFAGKRVACPKCKTPLTIPALATKPAAPQVTSKSPPLAAAKAAPAASPSVVIQCPKCAKKLKAPAQFAGKRVACPGCEAPIQIPNTSPAAPSNPRFPATSKTSSAPPKTPREAPRQSMLGPTSPPPPHKSPVPATPTNTLPPYKLLAAGAAAVPSAHPGPPPVRVGARPRFLYCAFALALLPLAFQTFEVDPDVEEQIAHTLESHPEIVEQFKEVDSDEELFAILPEGRIEGAHLSHTSKVHWLYALIAAAVFFGVMWLLFEPGRATPVQLLVTAGATSTVGIISLIAFQWIAAFSQAIWLRGTSIIVLIFYIIKFIGFSYYAADDPENGFWLSFLGFTFGVGLCEELTKALPVITWLHHDPKLGWRGACMLGLASGIGFGIAEGIMYSGQYYNGVMGFDIYLTRFISCVALHAAWTATASILVSQNMGGFETDSGSDWLFHLLLMIGGPAILHGLYDTLLKRHMGGYALVVAFISFALLFIVIERARSSDPHPGLRRSAIAAA